MNHHPTAYWRFILRNQGDVCAPCAWVLMYNFLGGRLLHISVHESSKAQITCARCKRVMWTLPTYGKVPDAVS